ncbi:Na+/H+ antiporter subunit E [Nonomuraea sp. NPDC048916]|uniref:Na+/H+ antiporter subunit E n=1 Tax=Nonomuraea sp. NPDC048916 TaxID=3154232 RepID=UPI0033D20B3C
MKLAPRLFGRRVPLPLVVMLALLWVTLWGDLSVGNVLGGLATGLVITWLLPLPVLDPGLRLHLTALPSFLVRFAGDMVASTVRVTIWVLRPGPPPTQVIPVRLRTSSDAMTMLVMVALSSVPGSLVLEVYSGRRELVLHILGYRGDVAGKVAADVAGLERRIVAAFGTRADWEEVR